MGLGGEPDGGKPGEDWRAQARRSFRETFWVTTDADGQRHIGSVLWGLLGAVPMAMMAVTAFLVVVLYQETFQYVRTTGEVVEVRSFVSTAPWNRGTTEYVPVFRYTWIDDQETRASVNLASASYDFEIGSRHEILFDPRRRTDVRIPGPHNWIIPALFVALTVVTVLAFAALHRRLRRWEAAGRKEDETWRAD